jgi:hypothetical protein
MARTVNNNLFTALADLAELVKTPDDLRIVHERVKEMRDRFDRMARYTFHVGDQASFMSKYGMMKTGVITQINRKTAYMKVDGFRWKVSLTLLKQPETVKGKVA